MGDHRLRSDNQAILWLEDMTLIWAKGGKYLICCRKHQPLLLAQGFYRIALRRLLLKSGSVPMVFETRIGAPITYRSLQAECTPSQYMTRAAGHENDMLDLLKYIRHHQAALPVGTLGRSIFIKGIPSCFFKKMDLRASRLDSPGHAGSLHQTAG